MIECGFEQCDIFVCNDIVRHWLDIPYNAAGCPIQETKGKYHINWLTRKEKEKHICTYICALEFSMAYRTRVWCMFKYRV